MASNEVHPLTFEDWLQTGIAEGWITEPFCHTHDGPPMTEAEVLAWDNDDDPCLYAVRLVSDDDRAELTEGNRS